MLSPDIELVMLGRTEVRVKCRDVVGTLAEIEFHVDIVQSVANTSIFDKIW